MKTTTVIFTIELLPEQHKGIKGLKSALLMTDLASEVITSRQEALRVAKEILAAGGQGRLNIYGVIATPVRWALEELIPSSSLDCVRIYEAFSIARRHTRALEGQPPYFKHKEWLLTRVWTWHV